MKKRFQNGFTLVELLIAMAVGAIILAAIYAMIDVGQKSSASVGRKVLTQQDARAVLDFMAMEVSMASFNPAPNNANTLWNSSVRTSSGTCASVAAFIQARAGIQIAADNSILVAMDLDGNGVMGYLSSTQQGDNEYIRYSYNATNGSITRNVSCSRTETILGGTNSSTMIRNNLVGVPLFQYFNAAGNNISANVINSPDLNIPLIRRIRINLVADVEAQQGKTFKVSRRTYTTDTLVRNHAIAYR